MTNFRLRGVYQSGQLFRLIKNNTYSTDLQFLTKYFFDVRNKLFKNWINQPALAFSYWVSLTYAQIINPAKRIKVTGTAGLTPSATPLP